MVMHRVNQPRQDAGSRELPQSPSLVRGFAFDLLAQTDPAQRMQHHNHNPDPRARVKLAPQPETRGELPLKSGWAILGPLLELVDHGDNPQQRDSRRTGNQLGKGRHQSDRSTHRPPPRRDSLHTDQRENPKRQRRDDRPENRQPGRSQDSIHSGQDRIEQPAEIDPAAIDGTRRKRVLAEWQQLLLPVANADEERGVVDLRRTKQHCQQHDGPANHEVPAHRFVLDKLGRQGILFRQLIGGVRHGKFLSDERWPGQEWDRPIERGL